MKKIRLSQEKSNLIFDLGCPFEAFKLNADEFAKVPYSNTGFWFWFILYSVSKLVMTGVLVLAKHPL